MEEIKSRTGDDSRLRECRFSKSRLQTPDDGPTERPRLNSKFSNLLLENEQTIRLSWKSCDDDEKEQLHQFNQHRNGASLPSKGSLKISTGQDSSIYPSIHTASTSALNQLHQSSTYLDAGKLKYNASASVTSQSSATALISEPPFIKQPVTRPISEQQLTNEVKGIYAGLVMVEKKCIDIVTQQSQHAKRLETHQWKALVALHRTLLQEHHDFFFAAQHPASSDALKRLATKYAMPAHMWRHRTHAFLETLRHRLPDSLEHMLSFIYLSYSMMAILIEAVPSFVDTWIECLGDLARYRMAIEDSNSTDREVWSRLARSWYNEAAYKSPDSSPAPGRLYHHLAVLARPQFVEVISRYIEAQHRFTSFAGTRESRESIMLLFPLFSSETMRDSSRHPYYQKCETVATALLYRKSGYASAQSLELISNQLDPGYIVPETTVNHDFPQTRDQIGLFGSVLRQCQNFCLSAHSRALRTCLKFHASVGVRILFILNIGRVLAYPVPNATTRDHSSSAQPDYTADLISLAISLVSAPSICLLGPRIVGNRDRIVTSALLCLLSTVLVGIATEAGLSIYFSRTCAGVSFGASIWLILETRDKAEWPLLQLVRYMVAAVACHYTLQHHSSDQFLDATIWLWSCLGSGALNGLINMLVKSFSEWAIVWPIRRRFP